MKTKQIRQKFLDFFGDKGHCVKRSAPLIPQDDPTLMFISAGMAAFKPWFLGTRTDMKRAASCQKCFRTTDIENVGYTARHHTFFEMLGNFSFGDYFKKEAIIWAWEFVTKEIGLDKDRLYVSIHHTDDEAGEIWHKETKIDKNRIIKLGDKDNFWTIGVGPSGPCSEIYYDQGHEIGCGKPDCAPGCDCDRFLEFWNLVFTQYDRAEDGTLTELTQKNIDTGLGLERLAAIMQGKTDNFNNDLFSQIITKTEQLTKTNLNDNNHVKTALRVVADHTRALCFAITDGAIPGNEGRAYILRKILRRASRFGFSYLNCSSPFLYKIVDTITESMSCYPELKESQKQVELVIKNEEERFLQTLKTGNEILFGLIEELKKKNNDILDGEKAFLLHDTYGFPLDLTCEMCFEQNIKVDTEKFNKMLEQQRERGRANCVSAFINFDAVNAQQYPKTEFTGYDKTQERAKVLDILQNDDKFIIICDKTPFYAESGGQAGDEGTITANDAIFEVTTTEKNQNLHLHYGTWKTANCFKKDDEVCLKVNEKSRKATMRNHTATHLLHTALRQVLGEHVKQAGSYVAPERLRFDFTHFAAMKPEEIEETEKLVNQAILENMKVNTELKSWEKAVSEGAIALFGEKYEDQVRVVSVGDFSCELCGGTHVSNSSEIGLFTITSEASAASGIRRIEAVTGHYTLETLKDLRITQKQLQKILECESKMIPQKTIALIDEIKNLKRKLQKAESSNIKSVVDQVKSKAIQVNDTSIMISRTDGLETEDMKKLSDQLCSESGKIALLAADNGKAVFVLKMSPDMVKKGLHAGKLVKQVAAIAGGGGGGRPDMATAGGKNVEMIDKALSEAKNIITGALN